MLINEFLQGTNLSKQIRRIQLTNKVLRLYNEYKWGITVWFRRTKRIYQTSGFKRQMLQKENLIKKLYKVKECKIHFWNESPCIPIHDIFWQNVRLWLLGHYFQQWIWLDNKIEEYSVTMPEHSLRVSVKSLQLQTIVSQPEPEPALNRQPWASPEPALSQPSPTLTLSSLTSTKLT